MATESKPKPKPKVTINLEQYREYNPVIGITTYTYKVTKTQNTIEVNIADILDSDQVQALIDKGYTVNII